DSATSDVTVCRRCICTATAKLPSGNASSVMRTSRYAFAALGLAACVGKTTTLPVCSTCATSIRTEACVRPALCSAAGMVSTSTSTPGKVRSVLRPVGTNSWPAEAAPMGNAIHSTAAAMRKQGLRNMSASRVHVDSVQRLAGGHEQPVAAGTAKAHVGARLRHADHADGGAVRRNHEHAG